MEAGFGLIRVSASLPPSAGHAARGARTVVVRDVKRGGVNTGVRRRYRVMVRTGAKLRVILCWYDVPGERLINDLDCFVPGRHAEADHQNRKPERRARRSRLVSRR